MRRRLPRFVDLSHTVEHGMVTYPGLPTPVISDHLSREGSAVRYDPGTTFQIGRIDMVANTGTYIDAPFHRYADGGDLADLDLASLAHLDAVVCRVPADARAIGPELFTDRPLRGRAVLVNTGWAVRWGTASYLGGHPFLTRAAAEHLRDESAALVGIDSLNIDDTADGSRPVHSILLRAGIPVVEHLRGLGDVPDTGFLFYAVPVKVRNLGSFPVRAFALLDE
mgnify:CR=1 FL=1